MSLLRGMAWVYINKILLRETITKRKEGESSRGEV
jgi:hypothetical protein